VQASADWLGRSTSALAASCLLFAGVFFLRLVDGNECDAVLLLLVLPIGLLTARFGLRAGLIAAATSLALVAAWAEIRHVDLQPLGYLTRTVVFLGFAVAPTLRPPASQTPGRHAPWERSIRTRPPIAERNAEVVKLSTNVRAMLRIDDGRALEVLVPERLHGRFEVGSPALVYVDRDGSLLGWYLPETGLGVDMRIRRPPETS
jgi:hypothetical protein